MQLEEIKQIAVLGLGVMGAQIALFLLEHGYIVKGWDPYLTEETGGNISKLAESSTKAKAFVDLGEGRNNSKFEISKNIEIVSDSQLVIEAVAENISAKNEVLLKVGQLISPDAIIASNTSSLSINVLSNSIADAGRFLGMHFFNPVPKMKLVEVVRGENTSQEVVELASALVSKLGKTPVLVKDSPGFIVNRLVLPLINEAAKLVEKQVAAAEDVDRAMKLGAGHPMGPLALGDLIGLDVCLAILKSLYKGEEALISNLIVELVAKNQLGRKTNKGFFQY